MLILTLIFHSIEEKMLAIQDKKRKLIAGAFRQSDNERRQQRIQDIRDIFGLWNFSPWKGEWKSAKYRTSRIRKT